MDGEPDMTSSFAVVDVLAASHPTTSGTVSPIRTDQDIWRLSTSRLGQSLCDAAVAGNTVSLSSNADCLLCSGLLSARLREVRVHYRAHANESAIAIARAILHLAGAVAAGEITYFGFQVKHSFAGSDREHDDLPGFGIAVLEFADPLFGRESSPSEKGPRALVCFRYR